jgi:AraC-like DNA-binding protein
VAAEADINTKLQITLSVGYGSLSAFNAAFRAHLNLAPTEYRASFEV